MKTFEMFVDKKSVATFQAEDWTHAKYLANKIMVQLGKRDEFYKLQYK